MGLNRVSNARTLRRLSARVGMPIRVAFARWFDPQTTLLAFDADGGTWVVPRSGPIERYVHPRGPLVVTARGVREQ